MMLFRCIKQHLSNTWSSVQEKVSNNETGLKKSDEKARIPEHSQETFLLKSGFDEWGICNVREKGGGGHV